MKRIGALVSVLLLVLVVAAASRSAPPKPAYVRKADRVSTILASLKESGLPTLAGTWHYIGPFDNTDNKGSDTAYPPEKEIDLQKTYPGKDGQAVAWKEFPKFEIGHVNNLARFKTSDDSVVYLYHEIEVDAPLTLPVALGSDDTLTVWLNNQRLVAENGVRSAAPDQDFATLELKAGKNQLLVKVGNVDG